MVCAFLLLIFLVASLAPAYASPKSEVPNERSIPDVLILVLVSQQMDSVSFIYSKVVKRSDVEADLANLLRETGWTAEHISVEDIQAGGSPSTTVEFSTLGTVNLASGAFPIEPIIKAFKNRRYIELQFMVSMPFKFRGLQSYEDKHIKISLRRGTNVYGYSVFVKDPNFTTLNLPLVQTEATTRKPAGGHNAKSLAFVLIIVLGFLVAMLTFFLTKRAAAPRNEN